ncbi:hypothetical protein KCU77_g3640, partial [Aureobasidium melanogenum]
MSAQEASNHESMRARVSCHESMRAQISSNLEILDGNGPYGIFITCAEGGYQAIVLDPNHRVVIFGDAEKKVHDSETEVLRTLLESTSQMVEEKCDKDQNDSDGRPRDPPSNQGDRPREASFPGGAPGGPFDSKPHGHFSFENNSNRQRPPHIPLPGTGPLPSGGIFGATSGRGLFGNSTDTQDRPPCIGAGQRLFAFGTNNNVQGQPTPNYSVCGSNTNVQGQPTPCLFGNNMYPQGQPTVSPFGPNTNAQGWHNGASQTPSAVPPANHCTNRAAGGLSGHCPSLQGLFGCNGDASGPSGAYDPRPFVPGLPVSYVNLNGLTVSVYSTTTVSSKTNRPNNQNNNTANNQSNNVDRFKPGHRGLWSSPFSPASTHANLEKSYLSGPFAPDNPQRPFQNGPTFQAQASPGPVTTPRDRRVPRGGLFGAQPDGINTSTDVSAKDKSSDGLFGQYTAVPGAYTPRCIHNPNCFAGSPTWTGHMPSLFGGPNPNVEAQEKLKRPFEDSPTFPATPGNVVEPTNRQTPRGGLFGTQPGKIIAPNDSHSNDKPTSDAKRPSPFGLKTSGETNATGFPPSPGSEVKKLWFGKHYKIIAAEVSRAQNESRRLRTANLPVQDCIQNILRATDHLDNESGILAAVVRASYEENREEVRHAVEEDGWVPESADFERRVHFSAAVEDASSLSDAEKHSNGGNNKSKGKAVDRPSQPTETATSKKKVSPKPTTPDYAPAAKKDAASSGGGLMGSPWATAAKLAGHTPGITEADNKSSGTISELSRVGAAMRAAAEQSARVPSIPAGSMFAPKPAPSGASIPGTAAATKQSSAPSFLFGSASRSVFAPAPAPALSTVAPHPTPAPSSFASSPFAPSAPSFGGPSVRPAIVPVQESVKESVGNFIEEPVEEAAKESVEVEKPAVETQKPATTSSTQTLAAQKKKPKHGGLFDSQYAS